ncbi:MAG: hypothetical protein KF832_07845 [Caldilineaceae bacterium]|nr:hypothetical protein [Caldilineaceae bacterium]
MTQLRYLFVAMCGWVFLLYNIERLDTPINIAPFVYMLVAASTILLLLWVRLSQLPLQWLFVLLFPIYGLLKWLFGHELGGASLPLTITELSALTVSVILARTIGQQLEEWRKVITSLTIGEMNDELQPFDSGQAQIYREIRRARRHQRAAALLAIQPIDGSGESAGKRLQDTPLHRFVEEVRRETLEKYVAARLAELLVAELGDLAIVTKRDDHFVTLLPETDRVNVQEITRKLQQAAKDKLDLHLKIGISTFPDEAVTFESMLENAETEMTNTKLALNVRVDKPTVDVANGVALEPAPTQFKSR